MVVWLSFFILFDFCLSSLGFFFKGLVVWFGVWGFFVFWEGFCAFVLFCFVA